MSLRKHGKEKKVQAVHDKPITQTILCSSLFTQESLYATSSLSLFNRAGRKQMHVENIVG
jgi:hypothetical protein